jgi:hypothetical protein
MTEFQNTVIELLKVIAHGQLVMMNVTPQTVGREHLVGEHAELLRCVFATLQSNAESGHSSHQLQDQAGDGTGEQTGG